MTNTNITERVIQNKTLMLEQLAKTPIVEIVCKKVSIGRTTYYRWLKEDTDFAKKAQQALADGIALINDAAESQIINGVQRGHFSSTKYWLQNNHEKYRNKLQVETRTINESLTPEQEELVRKALKHANLNTTNHD